MPCRGYMDITQLIVKKIKRLLLFEENKDFERWLAKEEGNECMFLRLKKMEKRNMDIGCVNQLNERKAWSVVLENMKFNHHEELMFQKNKYNDYSKTDKLKIE